MDFKKFEKKSKFKFFVSHRPLFSSFYQAVESRAMLFYHKEIDDLLCMNKIDGYLTAHLHHYERLLSMDGYWFRKGYPTFILGTGGNVHIWDNFDKTDMEFL